MTFADVVAKHGWRTVKLFLMYRYCQSLLGALPGQDGAGIELDLTTLSYKLDMEESELAEELELEAQCDDLTPEQVDMDIYSAIYRA